MSENQDIHSRIDAALAAQVRAPRLDRRFDAAVWRRIEETPQRTVTLVPAPVRTSRAIHWLRVGNAAGVVVAVLLLGYYGFQQLGGGIAPELLAVSEGETGLPGMSPLAWVITVSALAFGLKFTALGKWLS